MPEDVRLIITNKCVCEEDFENMYGLHIKHNAKKMIPVAIIVVYQHLLCSPSNAVLEA